ncbi:MAG TPA: response regulator, partial [Thermoanaerobaculia bacterium]|nr:response regulator [Thermoanaerobaculia bacterium]
GLATAFAIVRQCDGVITVDSEPDRGSTFRIFLPIVEAPAIRAEAASLAEPAPRGSERVLLVEDEEAVRRLARRVLVEQGYGVLEAATADEALDLVRRGTGPIDLVLTDVVMPGMSGPDLARSLEGLLPGVPVLFMSGHAEDALPGPRLDGARADFLPKPLTPGDLARKVRERLDERAT